MNTPDGSGTDREPEPPDGSAGPEPLLWRVLRSTIAPPVLGDGGDDAPLSARGRVLFWGTVSVLVLAIAVLFVVTVAR
ncbi:MAG: hypothetical protein ACLPVY_09020 [Acidimicrobiia bacterium]